MAEEKLLGAEPKEEKKEQTPPTDFKIFEVWSRSGQIRLEAVDGFWRDKIRAVGILEYCKDIVKDARVPEEKSPIITKPGGIMDFIRGKKKR